MSVQHTPGPWRVGGSTGLHNQTAINPAIGCAYGAGDEAAANARLIASAPELLAALQAAVEMYGKPGGPWNVPGSAGSWIALARAAIAKATGGADA